MISEMIQRLILWLCRRYDINPIEQARIQAGADVVERGRQWDAFYREEGGLRDMLNDIRREAFEVAGEIDPRETDKIYYWAMADRNVRKLQNRIEAVITSGRVELGRRNALELEQSNWKARASGF